MRLFPYFILAYIALGVQVGLGDYVSYKGATPNLVLIATVFIALNAPRDAALLGCLGLGLMHDLLTQQQPGLFALAYGLTGLIAAGAHQVVYREHPPTQFSMTLAGGIVVAIVLLLHGWIHPPGPALSRWIGGGSGKTSTQVSVAAVYLSPATEFIRAIYTAVLAPVILALLKYAKRPFAFRPPRRKLVDRN